MADLLSPRGLGRTGLEVTPICAGGSVLGSMPRVFGYDLSEADAIQTVLEVFRGPLNFLDTATGYSDGESERRIGRAIKENGGLPPGFILATKADRDPNTGDFSGPQVRRCFAQSQQYLHLQTIPLYYLHDPEHISFEEAMQPGGPVEEMVALKAAGLVGSLGVAAGPVDLLARYVETGLFDVVLTHNRYTLVDRSAADLLALAEHSGVAVVNAAPFGGGLLAKGTAGSTRYAYREASEAVISHVRSIEELCRRADIELAALALQFSLRQQRIGATVVGMSSPARVREILRLAEVPIPDFVWTELPSMPSNH